MKKTSLLMFTFLVGFGLISFASEGSASESTTSALVTDLDKLAATANSESKVEGSGSDSGSLSPRGQSSVAAPARERSQSPERSQSQSPARERSQSPASGGGDNDPPVPAAGSGSVGSSGGEDNDPAPAQSWFAKAKAKAKAKANGAWTWTKEKTLTATLIAAPVATGAIVADSALRMKNGEFPVVDVDNSDAKFGARLDKDLRGAAGLTLFNKALSVKYWRAGLVGLAAYGIKQEGFKKMFTTMGLKINRFFSKVVISV